MTISLNSPNTDNYWVGKGTIFVKFETDPGYVDIGNVSEMEFTPNNEKLDHFSSREGIKKKDRSIVVSQAATLRMVMEEWTPRNVSMALMGTAAITGAVATGTLTSSGTPANGDTVTIGTRTYTFQTVLTNVNGNVLIGASAATALANLSAAINGGAGAGTTYAALTTINTQVTGNGASPLVVTAKTGGAAGNAIATTDTSANLSWGAATLLGGVDGKATIPIFTDNVRVAAVKYVGTNDVGPKWNFEFPRVEFSPTAALALISAEWGPIEVTGDVVATGTPSTFGTADSTFIELLPVNTVLPQIGSDGTPAQGETLTAFPGVWSGNPTFTYVWKRAGTPIAGATSTTYVPVVADAGQVLTVTVTATNVAGAVAATSPGTPAIV